MNTIKLRIEEEKELYNHFDPDGTLLSEEVKTYVLSQVTEKPLPDPYTISIVAAVEGVKKVIEARPLYDQHRLPGCCR